MFDMRIKVASPVSRDFGAQPFSLWLWDTFLSTLLSSVAEEGASGAEGAMSSKALVCSVPGLA